MKQAMAILLSAIVVVPFLVASAQTVEQLGGACISGDVDKVKRLIEAGVDVNQRLRGVTNEPPLFFACLSDVGTPADRVEILKALIDAGASINDTFKAGLNCLHVAASSGHTAVIEFLVANGVDVNARATSGVPGVTPLHLAVSKGFTEFAEALIENGADLNAEDDSRGYAPLHLAIRNRHKEMAELLIAKGADVNPKDFNGETPLDMAVSKRDRELVDLLRKHGGITEKDHGGLWKHHSRKRYATSAAVDGVVGDSQGD